MAKSTKQKSQLPSKNCPCLCLSKLSKKNIDKIKIKYSFNNEFPLAERLNHLPTSVALDYNVAKSIPRPAEMKKNIKTLERLSCKLLDELIRKTSCDVKGLLDDTPKIFAEKFGYKNINLDNPNWSTFKFERDLKIFLKICRFTLQIISPDNGGRKSSSLPKHVIFKLATVYRQGTSQEPTCGWDDIEESYTGNFYKFLIDLAPLLRDLKIKLGTDKTIGKYAVEALKEFRKAIREFESHQ
jgi:hypothetical protein